MLKEINDILSELTDGPALSAADENGDATDLQMS